MESVKEPAIAEPLEIMAGIEMHDKAGRKYKGPEMSRGNKMTLEEY